jgi:hypothetical protein
MGMIESLRADFRGLDTSRRQLRRFALIVGSVLMLIALTIAWRGEWAIGSGTRALAGSGALLALLGLVAPEALRPLYRAWMGLALVLGHVMTRVLLALVFFLIVTPIGLVRRALGRDPIEKSAEPELDSYWIRREDGADAGHLERYW